VFKLSKPILEDADVIIATAWETAELIYRLKVMKRVVYFIQGDESLFDEPVKRHWQSRVIETWKYPWKKIVIAEFLREQIKKHDALDDIIKIPNGLDFNKYTLRMPVKNRNKYHITMLAHRFILKGTVDGIKALEIVRRKHCGLQVTVFSAYPKMEYIPDWIDYRHNPEQSELIVIYNNAAIFISSSHTEGFGLTLAEAMACGCATAVTDIPAYHDFTIQNETSLFSPVGDYTAMADNIMRFIESDLLRESFARSGYEYIRKKLSLEKSCNEFMKMIEGEI
jgi:glycosyltransferase involved in cell wall biosynthesis